MHPRGISESYFFFKMIIFLLYDLMWFLMNLLQEKIVELEANQKLLQQQLGEKQQAGSLAGGPPPMMTPTLPPGVIPGAPPMAQPLRPGLPRHPGYYAPSPVDYLSPQGYAAYAYTGRWLVTRSIGVKKQVLIVGACKWG